MKLIKIVIPFAMVSAIVSGSVFAAASAKFAASWDTDIVTVTATLSCDDPSAKCSKQAVEFEMATLHVGSKKSILVGVSSEIGIYLLTEAKGGRNSDGNRF